MYGFLRKMTTRLADPVDYFLRLSNANGDEEIHLNDYMGQTISLNFLGQVECLNCGTATRKSYSQGYCYACFKKLAQCDLCVMSPDRCHFAEGTCRDPEWGQRFCMQPHLVYLANSSGIKVGITKPDQIPTRWIDQGAVQAVAIMEVDTRQQAGLVEAIYKQHISDRTHWQRMLKADDPYVDLSSIRDDLAMDVSDDIDALRQRFGAESIRAVDREVQIIKFPINLYPTKVVSLNFDRTPEVSGRLLGIKAQYLILDTGVINLRKFTAYQVEFIAGPGTDSPASARTNSQASLF
jgi:hypothetical protein